MKISIVIPLFNEEKRFNTYFPELYNYIKSLFKKNDFEFICVNDGSRDKTKQIVNAFQKNHPGIRLFNVAKNKGKGNALKIGVSKALGDHIFFTDIDLSADIKMLPKLISSLSKADIVIASRRLKKSNLVIRQNVLRETMGRYYTMLTNKILGLSYADMTCGLKGGHNKKMKTLFSKMKVQRWSFDPEMLYLAKKHNLKVKEQAISWINNDQSKVNLLVDAWRSFKELLQIRINDLRGLYD